MLMNDKNISTVSVLLTVYIFTNRLTAMERYRYWSVSLCVMKYFAALAEILTYKEMTAR